MFNKFRERGLSVIPIRYDKGPKGKAPMHDDWSKWCLTLPTEEECNLWELKEYNRYGLCCGPASGILAIDIDTDDRNILDACKLSPLVKRGKRGETRFFKHNPLIFTGKIASIIDVLSIGKQTLIPPTVHPETGTPYVWLTPDTLENFSVSDLPEYPIEEFEALRSKLEGDYRRDVKTASSSGVDLTGGPWFNTDPTRGCPTGSQDRLKRIVNAMIARGATPDECARELIRYDTENHKPTPYFLDSTRPDCKGDPMVSAILFYANNLATANRRGNTATPQISGSEILQVEIGSDKERLSSFRNKDYPEPTGLIKDIRDLTVEYSERYMPNIALGGAVAMMAAVCSNRFRFNQCWTNAYVLNLAPTGTGKSYPQAIISKILNESLGTKLMGFGNYQSSGAFTKNLVSRRERFDVIDEISSLFAQMKSGGLWQTSILEEMCKVWSSSSGFYNAAEYAEKEDTSSCFNPCVNILGSSTTEGIKPHISKMMVTKGLIPRFLIFKDDDYGPRSKDKLNVPLLQRVVKQIESILCEPKRERNDAHKDMITGPIYNPIDLCPINDDAAAFFDDIRDDFFRRVETEESMPVKDMLTRGKEQTMKLATMHASGNFRSIEVADLEWGKNTFEVCLHNARGFIEETAVDTDWEKDVQAVLNVFKKNRFITTATLSNRLDRLQPQRRRLVIEHLLGAEKIMSVTDRKVPGWTLKDAVNSSSL